jgi:putative membrane protein
MMPDPMLPNTNMSWVKATTHPPAFGGGGGGGALPATTQLTLEVVRLGLEQAIMDWVRTSMSLITFGFTIYKFFQIDPGRGEEPHRLVSPRGFAIAMIALGILSMVLATFQHLRGMREVRRQYRDRPPPHSLASLVSVSVSVLGIVALLLAVFRQ